MFYKTMTLRNSKSATLSWLEDGDLLELVTVLNGVIREDKYLWLDEELPERLESVREWFEKSKTARDRNLVARVDGKLAGTARLMPLTGKRAHIAQLAIYIAENCRNFGLGTILISELVKVASESGFEVVQLSSFSSNQRAVHVYEKCGFRMCGKYTHSAKFKDGTYADLILLELLLSP